MTNLDNFLGGFTKNLKEQCPEDLQLKAGCSDKASGILVHKLVLSTRSKVFKKRLESDEFKACNRMETVTLSDMDQEELEAFVEFIYSDDDGCFSSPKLKKHVKSLYIAADKYEIPFLTDICRHHLICSMDPSNALDLLEFCQIPFDKALNDAALEFITNHLRTISSESDEFKLFISRTPDLMVEILNTVFAFMDNRRRISY